MRIKEAFGRIGFGCGIGNYGAKHQYEDLEASIHSSFGAGVRLFDTAPVYGGGQSEEIVGKCIREFSQREQLMIATKVSPEDCAREKLIASVEKSLIRLKCETLDLLQIHWLNPEIPLEETLGTMLDLVGQGKVGSIGVCNFSMRDLRLARSITGTKLRTVQSEYNLFDRSAESEILPFCMLHGLEFLAYSPLHRGRLSNGKVTRDLISRLATERGCTPAQLVLAWLSAQSAVIPIPNSTNFLRAKENAEAMSIELDCDTVQLIGESCRSEVREVPVSQVEVDADAGRRVYRTLAEALENPLGLTPSPLELSYDIANGEFLKPVRVVEVSGDRPYSLQEGRLRFWAWVIAFGETSKIPVLVDLQ